MFLFAAIIWLSRFILFRRFSSACVGGVVFPAIEEALLAFGLPAGGLLGAWFLFGGGGGLDGRFIDDCLRRPGNEDGGGVGRGATLGGGGSAEEGGAGGGGGGCSAAFRDISSALAASSCSSM